MAKQDAEYWKDKYLQLLEKHTRVGEAILQALKNIEPKKQIRRGKTISSSRGK